MLKPVTVKDLDPMIGQIDKEWMLITAGDEQSRNTMTASWGTFGTLWNKPVSIIFVRPQRYTYEFCENNDYYSLCFFDESYHKSLLYCGTKSGRDVDKESECGLTPAFDLAPYYNEAHTVVICKKLYAQDLDQNLFIDTEVLDKNYPARDMHRVYVGEIVKVLKK